MDLVDWSRGRLRRDQRRVRRLRRPARLHRRHDDPDLGAHRRQRRLALGRTWPGIDGPSLLHHLENVYIASDRNLVDVRFPVQYVIRPQNGQGDYRAFAGQVVSGVMRPGDEVLVLPSGLPSRIKAIDTARRRAGRGLRADVGHRAARGRGRRVAWRHDRAGPNNQPVVTQDLDAMICWMDEHRDDRGRQVRDQAHHAVGARPGQGDRVRARRQHAAPQPDAGQPRAERDRSRGAAHDPAADGRPLPAQPRSRGRSSSSTRPRTAPSARAPSPSTDRRPDTSNGRRPAGAAAVRRGARGPTRRPCGPGPRRPS